MVADDRSQDAIAAIALLDEPTRRRIHRFVTAAAAAVGRDDVAAALSISRELAAFHLDRLVAGGLLATEFRRRLLGEHIELKTVRAADAWYVRADPIELEQVLLNLAVNARDAMPSGGLLTIETRNVEGVPSGAGQPDMVALSVTDTGVGMDAETQARVFEPAAPGTGARSRLELVPPPDRPQTGVGGAEVAEAVLRRCRRSRSAGHASGAPASSASRPAATVAAAPGAGAAGPAGVRAARGNRSYLASSRSTERAVAPG